MKKYILFGLILLLLSSCGESKELTKAKDDLLDRTVVETTTEEDNSEKEKKNVYVDQDHLRISPTTSMQYLQFDSFWKDDLQDGEVIISWDADSDVEKIQVLFSNNDSDFPDDNYTLQTYELWSQSFKYIASSKNQVLDFWKNVYTFRAYKWKEYSETEITIIFREEQETSWTETKLIGSEDDILTIDLPSSSKYGEPVRLGEESFTYSDIKGLEISKEIIPQVSCEDITDFLWERINTWYYWNTCRDLVKDDKGIYFNVLRLDWDQYIYERHYIDFLHGLYATYELETGTWVDSENIAEKNTEFKEQDFTTTDLVDGLMRDIITN